MPALARRKYGMLKVEEVKIQLRRELDVALASSNEHMDRSVTVDEDWMNIRDTTYTTAAAVLGFQAGRHQQDWFDEQDTEARAFLDAMHTTHLA